MFESKRASQLIQPDLPQFAFHQHLSASGMLNIIVGRRFNWSVGFFLMERVRAVTRYIPLTAAFILYMRATYARNARKRFRVSQTKIAFINGSSMNPNKRGLALK